MPRIKPRRMLPIQRGKRGTSFQITHRDILGFTLIELMLVIVIISSILVISLPRFRSTFGDLKVRNFIHNLICLGYYAREKSILESRIYRINLDFSKSQYWLTYQDPATGQFLKLNTRIARIQPIPEGISIQIDTEHIDFYPDGTVDSVSISITKDDKKTYIINSDENTGLLKFQIPKQ